MEKYNDIESEHNNHWERGTVRVEEEWKKRQKK